MLAVTIINTMYRHTTTSVLSFADIPRDADACLRHEISLRASYTPKAFL